MFQLMFRYQLKCLTFFKGGGTGFLGSQLVNAFKKKASRVLVVSRMPGVNLFSWVSIYFTL